MDWYTEVVNEKACAVWFEEGGRVTNVAIWFDEANHEDIEPVVEYLEDQRWTRQLARDVGENGEPLIPETLTVDIDLMRRLES